MATTQVNIKTVEWSKNPCTISEAILFKVYVTLLVTDTIKCDTALICNTTLICGSQVTTESNMT